MQYLDKVLRPTHGMKPGHRGHMFVEKDSEVSVAVSTTTFEEPGYARKRGSRQRIESVLRSERINLKSNCNFCMRASHFKLARDGLVGRNGGGKPCVAPRAPVPANHRCGVRAGSATASQGSSMSLDDCFLPCGVEDMVLDSGDWVGRGEGSCWAMQQAHSGAITAMKLFTHQGRTKVLSAGMDKTVAIWSVAEEGQLEIEKRIVLSGGPCFSLHVEPPRQDDDGFDSILMGTHAKNILSWAPSRSDLDNDAYSVIENHCGWVRSLVTNDRWLFSAACNEIKQFDNVRAVPSLVSTQYLDKGDILNLACTKDRLFAGTVDGCLYGFSIDKAGGLALSASRVKAHNGRVTDLKVHKGLLYSSSYDGSIKSWDLQDLEIVDLSSNAHGGQRVNSLEVGCDGILYSGGGDGAVRAWESNLLVEMDVVCSCDEPVRSLAVSSDALCVGTGEGTLLVKISLNVH